MLPSRLFEILSQIQLTMGQFGEELRKGCDLHQLDILQNDFYATFDERLPDSYLEFLSHHDGFDWDGTRVYASHPSRVPWSPNVVLDSVIDVNQEYRTFHGYEDLLILGSSNMDIFVYDTQARNFANLARVGLHCWGRYESFLDLLTKNLSPKCE